MADQKQTTVRVRVCVAIDHNGEWSAFGRSCDEDKEAQDSVYIEDLADGEHYHWIEATVPVPMREHAQIIEGALCQGQEHD